MGFLSSLFNCLIRSCTSRAPRAPRPDSPPYEFAPGSSDLPYYSPFFSLQSAPTPSSHSYSRSSPSPPKSNPNPFVRHSLSSSLDVSSTVLRPSYPAPVRPPHEFQSMPAYSQMLTTVPEDEVLDEHPYAPPPRTPSIASSSSQFSAISTPCPSPGLRGLRASAVPINGGGRGGASARSPSPGSSEEEEDDEDDDDDEPGGEQRRATSLEEYRRKFHGYDFATP